MDVCLTKKNDIVLQLPKVIFTLASGKIEELFVSAYFYGCYILKCFNLYCLMYVLEKETTVPDRWSSYFITRGKGGIYLDYSCNLI